MRSAVLALVAVALLAATPAVARAGWRSADRQQLEDDDVGAVIDEPCERDVQLEHHDDGSHHLRRETFRETQQPGATQPYWGTMRPYWNAGEAPGVRPLRTRGLK